MEHKTKKQKPNHLEPKNFPVSNYEALYQQPDDTVDENNTQLQLTRADIDFASSAYPFADYIATSDVPSKIHDKKCASKVRMKARVHLRGANIESDMFAFGVFDESDVMIARVKNDSRGKINFPKIPLETSGIYRFTIRELSKSSRSTKMDNKMYRVKVTVTERRKGKYRVAVKYFPKLPFFNNYIRMRGQSRRAIEWRSTLKSSPV